MKRMHLGTKLYWGNLKVSAGQIPEEIKNLNERLQLLYDVPMSYLIPEPSFLPPESIRFFYIDRNYVKAMLNGASSIGRITKTDRMADCLILKTVSDISEKSSGQLRLQKVHKNHHGKMAGGMDKKPGIRTGFLLRSTLIHKRKGLSICGYAGQEPLSILRLETLAPDIMIGIFEGELTRLVIAEPSCGLRFGCQSPEWKNRVLSLKNPGEPIPDTFYDVKTNSKGRIDILSMAAQITHILKEKKEIEGNISSGIFAYEFLQAAQKAEFTKKLEEER